MNTEVFKRNVQLSKLGISELDNVEKKVYEFLVNNLTGLCAYTSDKKLGILYFGKSADNIVLCYNLKEEVLHVDYNIIWSFFKYNLSIESFDIDSLIKWWVGMTLNSKPKHISFGLTPYNSSVGGGLDLKPKHTIQTVCQM